MVFLAATPTTKPPASHYSIVVATTTAPPSSFSSAVQVQPTPIYKKVPSPPLLPERQGLLPTITRRIATAGQPQEHCKITVIEVNSDDDDVDLHDHGAADDCDNAPKQNKTKHCYQPNHRLVDFKSRQLDQERDHHNRKSNNVKTITGGKGRQGQTRNMSRHPSMEEFLRQQQQQQQQQQEGSVNPHHAQQQERRAAEDNALLSLYSAPAAATRRQVTTGATAATTPVVRTSSASDLHLSRPPPPSLMGVVPPQDPMLAGRFSSRALQDYPPSSETLLPRGGSANIPIPTLHANRSTTTLENAEEEWLLLQQQQRHQRHQQLLLAQQQQQQQQQREQALLLEGAARARGHLPQHHHPSALDMSSPFLPQVSYQDEYSLSRFPVMDPRLRVGAGVAPTSTTLPPHSHFQQHLEHPSTLLASSVEEERDRMLLMGGVQTTVASAGGMMPPRPVSLVRGSVVPRDADVLCGRGRGVGSKPGNVFYNQLIQSKRREYRKLEKREKQAFAAEIHNKITERGGRFLSYNVYGQWQLLEERRVLEKICTALRKTSHMMPKGKDKKRKKKKRRLMSKKKKVRHTAEEQEDKRTNWQKIGLSASKSSSASEIEAVEANYDDEEEEEGDSSEGDGDDDDLTEDDEDTETDDDDDDDDDDDEKAMPEMPQQTAIATTTPATPTSQTTAATASDQQRRPFHKDESREDKAEQVEERDVNPGGNNRNDGLGTGGGEEDHNDNDKATGALVALSEAAASTTTTSPEDSPDADKKRSSVSTLPGLACADDDAGEEDSRLLPVRKRRRPRTWMGPQQPSHSTSTLVHPVLQARRSAATLDDHEFQASRKTDEAKGEKELRPSSVPTNTVVATKKPSSSSSIPAKGGADDVEDRDISRKKRARQDDDDDDDNDDEEEAVPRPKSKGTPAAKWSTSDDEEGHDDSATILCCSTCHLPLVGSTSSSFPSSNRYCTCPTAGPAMLIEKGRLFVPMQNRGRFADRGDEVSMTSTIRGSGHLSSSSSRLGLSSSHFYPAASTFRSAMDTGAGTESTIPQNMAVHGASVHPSVARVGVVLPSPQLTVMRPGTSSSASSLSESQAGTSTALWLRQMEEQQQQLHSAALGQHPSSASLPGMFPRTRLSGTSLAAAATGSPHLRHDLYSPHEQAYLRHHLLNYPLNNPVIAATAQGRQSATTTLSRSAAASMLGPPHHQHDRMYFAQQQQQLPSLTRTNPLLLDAETAAGPIAATATGRQHHHLQLGAGATGVLLPSHSFSPTASSALMEQVVTPSDAAMWQNHPPPALASSASASASASALSRHANTLSSPVGHTMPAAAVVPPNLLAPEGSPAATSMTMTDSSATHVPMAAAKEDELASRASASRRHKRNS